MSVTTQRTTASPVLVVLVVILLLGIAIWGLLSNGYDSRPDSDCIEWGVQVIHPNKTRGWALLPAIPKSREEAEAIAHQLESQDAGGRYYEAKCRRFKGE